MMEQYPDLATMLTTKKYRCWIHFDTGVEVVVDAKDREDARDKVDAALGGLTARNFNRQISENLQMGDSDVLEEVK